MDRNAFFELVLSDCTSNEEKAVKLLQLLGYFIHNVDGDYYLSDNALTADAETLEELFNMYSLGETRRNNIPRIICGKMQSSYSPPDKSIMDLSFSVSRDSLYRIIDDCFKSDRFGGEAGPAAMEWYEFLNGKPPKKVSVYCLEPFIAYYVKAVSACGVATCYSCDGNHPAGGKVICGSNYPFSLFHKRIWLDVCTKFGIVGDIENGIPFDSDSQYDLYYKMYQAAQYLYENRMRYREMKYDAILILRDHQKEMRKNKKKPTDEQYKDWFSKELGLIGNSGMRLQ